MYFRNTETSIALVLTNNEVSRVGPYVKVENHNGFLTLTNCDKVPLAKKVNVTGDDRNVINLGSKEQVLFSRTNLIGVRSTVTDNGAKIDLTKYFISYKSDEEEAIELPVHDTCVNPLDKYVVKLTDLVSAEKRAVILLDQLIELLENNPTLGLSYNSVTAQYKIIKMLS
jgi:hypothetical protein